MQVHTVPGPCAAIAALTLAGLADRPLPVPRLPSRQGQGARRRDRRGGATSARRWCFTKAGRGSATRLLRLPQQLGDARSGGRARDHQAPRGMRDRHARRACRALCRRTAQGRDRDRRRPAARSGSRRATTSSTPRSTRRWPALSPSRAAAEVAERLERAAQARLRPRARARRNEPPGSREARPRRRDPRLLVFAPERLANPRPARPRAVAAKSTSSPAAAACSPSSR